MNTKTRKIQLSTNFLSDIAGITCSALCLAHCLLLPLLIATGLSSLTFLSGEVVHLILLGPVFLFAAIGSINGYQLHKQYVPGLIAAIGLICFVIALLVHGVFESILTAIGACILISAHLSNQRLINE